MRGDTMRRVPRRRFELGQHLLGTRVDINGARFMYLRDGSFIGAHIRGKNWT